MVDNIRNEEFPIEMSTHGRENFPIAETGMSRAALGRAKMSVSSLGPRKITLKMTRLEFCTSYSGPPESDPRNSTTEHGPIGPPEA
jgi:hypothetical protein